MRKEPYETIPGFRVIVAVATKRMRPKIPPTLDLTWASLIRRCWAEEPEVRPEFPDLLELFVSMKLPLPAKKMPYKEEDLYKEKISRGTSGGLSLSLRRSNQDSPSPNDRLFIPTSPPEITLKPENGTIQSNGKSPPSNGKFNENSDKKPNESSSNSGGFEKKISKPNFDYPEKKPSGDLTTSRNLTTSGKKSKFISDKFTDIGNGLVNSMEIRKSGKLPPSIPIPKPPTNEPRTLRDYCSSPEAGEWDNILEKDSFTTEKTDETNVFQPNIV